MTTQIATHVLRGQGGVMPSPGLIDRWTVLQLVKDSAKITGIREREISILAAHLSVLPKGMVDPRHLLVSYAQVSGMLDRANCMDERRFRRGEARLEELGFITRKLSANGRRFPVRDGKGTVVDAYGIDLAPLFRRISELHKALQNHREDEAQRRALRSRISARLSAVKRQALTEMGTLTPALSEKMTELRNRLRRSDTSLNDLIRMEQEVENFTATDPEPPVAQPKCSLSISQQVAPKKSADGSQIVRHIESQRKEDKSSSCPVLNARPMNSWTDYPNLSLYYPESPKSNHAMAAMLYEFFGFLGLGQSMKKKIMSTFGLSDAMLVADYVAGRIQSIARPSGYLQHMISDYLKGNAVAAGRVCTKPAAVL